jgi:hypothetical protein
MKFYEYLVILILKIRKLFNSNEVKMFIKIRMKIVMNKLNNLSNKDEGLTEKILQLNELLLLEWDSEQLLQ